MSYGKINTDFLIAGLLTDYSETLEFIYGISVQTKIFLILTFISLITIYFKKIDVKSKKISLILFFIFFFISPVFKHSMYSSKYYIEAENHIKLLSNSSKKTSFHLTKNTDNKYKNIVVIIGESVSRDYMSIYGYPHNTTPWIKKNFRGYIFNNYISTAAHTAESIPRTLSVVKNDIIQTENNVVSLAKLANYKTYWISNQSIIGRFDTPISAIASYADSIDYIRNVKGNNFKTIGNKDDHVLIEKLKIYLKESNENKVFFIHMNGSHPSACNRLYNHPYIKYINSNQKEHNCYLSSISKLDSFIKEIDSTLMKDNNKDYAWVYFSDHGVSLIDDSDRPLKHDNSVKENFHVPLLIHTNDKNDIETIPEYVSAYNFMSIFQSIIGVKTTEINSYPFHIITKERIKVVGSKQYYDELGSYKALK